MLEVSGALLRKRGAPNFPDKDPNGFAVIGTRFYIAHLFALLFTLRIALVKSLQRDDVL